MKRLLPLLLIPLFLSGCAGIVAVGAVGGAVMVNDERPLRTQLDDTNADFKIASALAKHDDIKNQTHIIGIVMNGDTLLIGQAPNDMLRDKAIRIVKSLHLGGKIHNQINIGNPTSFTTRSNDTWITTKVKGRMLNVDGLDMTKIKVITENGEVYLMGLVSQKEANIAIDIARNTSGVRKVISVFEHTNK